MNRYLRFGLEVSTLALVAALIPLHLATSAFAGSVQRRRKKTPPPIRCYYVYCTGITADRTTLTAGQTAALEASCALPDGLPLTYRWSTTGGRIESVGPRATFDSAGVAPGTYTVTVNANRDGNTADCSITIQVVSSDDAPN